MASRTRVVLTIRGKKHSLWRAVDQHGNVLDILVQSRRNKQAAKRFFRKLLKELNDVPRVIITDTLKSYAAAKRDILPGVEHRQHKRREHPSGEFASTNTLTREENAQIQISPHMRNTFSLLIAPIAGHFQPRRHHLSAVEYHAILQIRFHTWNEITRVMQAASPYLFPPLLALQ